MPAPGKQRHDPRATVEIQRGAQTAEAEEQRDALVDGLADLTSGGLPVDPVDVDDLVDSVVN